jgi:hypothetical protein
VLTDIELHHLEIKLQLFICHVLAEALLPAVAAALLIAL